MIFVVCHPCNSGEAQIGLALNLLCGFGVNEIAHAFITNKEVVYKRLQRAKENLRHANITVGQPSRTEILERLPSVLMTLYLLFNEGYYSSHSNNIFSKELCGEAIRLVELLLENKQTTLPSAHALLALMFFQCSRLDARSNDLGEVILYDDQDQSLWDMALIKKERLY
jgi:RNA polymerase sigma-70 factor (ECF subfamily)